jgi:hypothetical protein
VAGWARAAARRFGRRSGSRRRAPGRVDAPTCRLEKRQKTQDAVASLRIFGPFIVGPFFATAGAVPIRFVACHSRVLPSLWKGSDACAGVRCPTSYLHPNVSTSSFTLSTVSCILWVGRSRLGTYFE